MGDETPVSEKLKGQFLKEASERLKDLERGLLNIEQNQDLMSQIRLIFRGFHGLKGIAAYVNAREIIDLSNAGENLLMQVRDEGIPFRPQWVDLLLACHDDLKSLLEAFRSGRTPDSKWRERLVELQSIVRENVSPGQQGDVKEDQRKLFLETADAMINGLEIYLRKWKPGAPDKRLITAIKRKLALFSRSAADAGRADLVAVAERYLKRIDTHPGPVWTALQLEEFARVSEELRSTLKQTTGSIDRGSDSSHDAIPSEAPPKRHLEVNTDYVEMLEALVSDFSTYILGIRHDLNSMKPMMKPRAVSWLGGMESDLGKFARAFVISCRRLHLKPLSSLFERLPRLVRDLAKREAKNVQLVVSGGEVELEENQVEKLAEPLIHLLRNSLDHGIEKPEDRSIAGKNEKALIKVEASTSKGKVIVDVVDDGRGIDFEAIRRKAVELRLLSEEKAEKLPPTEMLDLIFLNGLSTKQIADTISGRGVGMDIVREAVKELGGTVDVDSTPGEGTRFRMKIPLELDH